MSYKELLRRYTIFFISIIIIALGITIIVKANLGTSPISSAAFVFSINTPMTIGTYLFILNMILISLQMLLLGKKKIIEKKIELLAQIPVSIIFGLCADFSMWILSNLHPDSYTNKMILLITGCFILALGISLEVIANVSMMSGEYTVQIISTHYKKEFGSIKILFDVSLVIIAIISSIYFSSKIEGVREGTIITALITGPFIKLIMPHLNFINKWQTAAIK